jgi:hypothetical protein
MADFGHQGKRVATKTIKDKVIRIFKQKHSLQKLDKLIGSTKTRQNHSLQRLDKIIGFTQIRQNHRVYKD